MGYYDAIPKNAFGALNQLSTTDEDRHKLNRAYELLKEDFRYDNRGVDSP